MLRAVGSQLIYNPQSKQSIFFGALSSDRFLTIMHLKVNPDDPAGIGSYTVDSSGLRKSKPLTRNRACEWRPGKNLLEFSLPLARGCRNSTLSV